MTPPFIYGTLISILFSLVHQRPLQAMQLIADPGETDCDRKQESVKVFQPKLEEPLRVLYIDVQQDWMTGNKQHNTTLAQLWKQLPKRSQSLPLKKEAKGETGR